jgi:hypothetical protein
MNPVSDLRVDVMDDEIIVRLPGRAICYVSYQAKAELHFTFGALAVESHFMPAFSQADWLLGVGAVKPTARTRARIVTKPFMARLLRFC